MPTTQTTRTFDSPHTHDPNRTITVEKETNGHRFKVTVHERDKYGDPVARWVGLIRRHGDQFKPITFEVTDSSLAPPVATIKEAAVLIDTASAYDSVTDALVLMGVQR